MVGLVRCCIGGLLEEVKGGPGGVRRPWSREGEVEFSKLLLQPGTSRSSLSWRLTDGLSLQVLLNCEFEASNEEALQLLPHRVLS